MHASWRGKKRTASEIEGNFNLSQLLRDICVSLSCGLLCLPVVLNNVWSLLCDMQEEKSVCIFLITYVVL